MCHRVAEDSEFLDLHLHHIPILQIDRRLTRRAHAGDVDALEVAAGCEREIELYEEYRGSFGYVFFELQRPGERA